MSYHVSGPGKATNNSIKQRAHSFINGIVTNEYFNDEWKNKTKNYSVWNENGKFIGFALTKKALCSSHQGFRCPVDQLPQFVSNFRQCFDICPQSYRFAILTRSSLPLIAEF